MGMQQISDRMRTGPTQVLRAVFAGIGRILLTADRPEARPAAASRGAGASAERRSGRSQASEAAARWRDLDKTGNVRLLSAEDMALEFGAERAAPAAPATAAAATPAATATRAATATPTAATAPTAPTAAGPTAGRSGHGSGAAFTDAGSANGTPVGGGHDGGAAQAGGLAAELPLADYEQLSLPSIRARLRGLDVDQLRVLAQYERTHAERPEVLGMFERRIEKLAAHG
jgi:hypothetical protein